MQDSEAAFSKEDFDSLREFICRPSSMPKIVVGSAFPLDCPKCEKATQFAKVSFVEYQCLECEKRFHGEEATHLDGLL